MHKNDTPKLPKSKAASDSEDSEGAPASPKYIQFAPQFLAIEEPPPEYLMQELIPSSVMILPHGEPRTMKSWAALEIGVCCATGKAGFNLERFSVLKPLPVLYSSQEDAAQRVRERVKLILNGKGIRKYPDTLAFSVHKGIDLDNEKWHQRLLQDIKHYGFKLIIFDPIRRYTQNVDTGPDKVQKVTGFLVGLCVETGATVYIVHHDVKPNGWKAIVGAVTAPPEETGLQPVNARLPLSEPRTRLRRSSLKTTNSQATWSRSVSPSTKTRKSTASS